jgi:L-threonylcarbamoyladenylate synthase
VPRVVVVDPRAPEETWDDAIGEATRLLLAGRLVAFPTETVYGLGARALDADAVRRVFEAKGRPHAHPLIAHVAGERGARALASEWSPRASRLARAFWPGPLTLVVPRAAHVPAAVAGGGDSIAVRAPAHPVARALLARLGEPIAAPSANRYQSISPTLAEHVVRSLGDRVDLVLDGGACEAGIESSVVDVRGDRARLLRPGAVSIAELRRIEATIEGVSEATLDDDAPRPSPGMDVRHYSPRAGVLLGGNEARALALATERTGAILRRPLASPLPESVLHRTRVLPGDPVGFAAQLFAALHELDELGLDHIFVEDAPPGEAWDAVRDRLRRARG